MNVATLLAPRHLIIILLSLCLIVVCYFYIQTTNTPAPTPIIISPSSMLPDPHTTSSDAANIAVGNDQGERAIPVTPEEKSIIAEKEYLSAIAAEGERIITEFNATEKELAKKNQQAQEAIARLEAKVQGLNQ